MPARFLQSALGREQAYLLPAIFFLGFFYVLPILNLVRVSLSTAEGYSLANFARALGTTTFQNAWANSVAFASASAAIAVAGGLALAFWTATRGRKTRAILLAVYALPYTMSGLVVAFGFIVVTGRNGIINQLVDSLLGTGPILNLRSWGGLLAVFPFYNIPLAALILTPLVEKLGRDLREAAAICGAGTLATWRLVLLPALAPGLIAAASLVFATMMGAFGTALAITGFSRNLLSLQIYAQSSESGYDLPLASALAVVLMLTTLAVLFFLSRLDRRRR